MHNKEFIKLLGIIYDTKTCEKCCEEVRYQIVIIREWKMLGIPIFPTSKKYCLSCPICGKRIEISHTETRQYLNNITKEKTNHKHKKR